MATVLLQDADAGAAALEAVSAPPGGTGVADHWRSAARHGLADPALRAAAQRVFPVALAALAGSEPTGSRWRPPKRSTNGSWPGAVPGRRTRPDSRGGTGRRRCPPNGDQPLVRSAPAAASASSVTLAADPGGGERRIAGQEAGDHRRLGRAGDQPHDPAGPVDGRRGERHAEPTVERAHDGDVVGGVDDRVARRPGGGVAVVAEAEVDDVEIAPRAR